MLRGAPKSDRQACKFRLFMTTGVKGEWEEGEDKVQLLPFETDRPETYGNPHRGKRRGKYLGDGERRRC